jgi:multidrug efflux pump
MRHAMGVAVFAGMLGVTFFGLFLTPVFYVTLRTVEKRLTGRIRPVNHSHYGSPLSVAEVQA